MLGLVMRRDYRLYELNDEEFEHLVVGLCVKWLGEGVTPFAPGRDGGRDGKFSGTAACFPSSTAPLSGHFVLQAKHVSAPNKSCSDRDFIRLLKKEHPKIRMLVRDGVCDHYLAFTNRKLTGGADLQLTGEIRLQGPKTAHIIGTERLHMALDIEAEVRALLPNIADVVPFRFESDDLVEVIGAVHDFVHTSPEGVFDSAHDFDAVHLKTVKNKINGLSEEYFSQVISEGSLPHFHSIGNFLKNPRNQNLANLYHDSADELKRKILSRRTEFDTFDEVFGFIIEQVQNKRVALKGKRRMVSILIHYMYCNCDIGSKLLPAIDEAKDVDA
jgi:hypothetical protein